MKKIAIHILMFSMVGLLFDSCSRFSDVAIAKRHYRSGYYIETSASVNSVKKQETKVPQTIAASDKGVQQNINETQTMNEIRTISSGNYNKAIAEKKENFATTKLRDIKSTVHAILHPEILSPDINNPNKGSEVYRRIFPKDEITALNHRYDDGGRHALGGVLWFLVVLLLILFLLNFLLELNLGGLVYLILVVALILLLFRLIGML
jgi:hypothetical protein